MVVEGKQCIPIVGALSFGQPILVIRDKHRIDLFRGTEHGLSKIGLLEIPHQNRISQLPVQIANVIFGVKNQMTARGSKRAANSLMVARTASGP